VVISNEDDERVIEPTDIVDFFQNSPLAAAIRDGLIPEVAFERERNEERGVDFK
jgi:hypothetical protein